MFYVFQISKTSKRKMYIGANYFMTAKTEEAQAFNSWQEVNRHMGILNAKSIYEVELIKL